MSIDLRCCSAAALIADLPDQCSPLLHADPAWQYSGGQTDTRRGLAGQHYETQSDEDIAAMLADTARLGTPDSYLMVWCTFPKLAEFFAAWFQELRDRRNVDPDAPRWEYVSGGAWGKIGGLGVGYHFRGDAELLLCFKQGSPTPFGGSQSNLWLERRSAVHSEKPQLALRALCAMVPPDSLIVDLCAGESASLAIAARETGRQYVGAEIAPDRHAIALRRLSQQQIFAETWA